MMRAREAGDSALMLWADARFAGSIVFSIQILGLAPQALCFRPLRGLHKKVMWSNEEIISVVFVLACVQMRLLPPGPCPAAPSRLVLDSMKHSSKRVVSLSRVSVHD